MNAEKITMDAEATRGGLRMEHLCLRYGDGDEEVVALDDVSVAVNAGELVGRIGGAPRAATRSKALALLDEVGLAAKAGRRPGRLSGGERQRVGIARALMAEPTVLLVDEPTSALDHQRATDIVTLLRDETRRHQIATLRVTHDRSVAGLADRVIEMRDGRLIGAIAPSGR